MNVEREVDTDRVGETEPDDEPGIFEVYDQAAEDAAIAEARADHAAGRVVSHEKVVAWLRTWGTPEEGPPPAEWFE